MLNASVRAIIVQISANSSLVRSIDEEEMCLLMDSNKSINFLLIFCKQSFNPNSLFSARAKKSLIDSMGRPLTIVHKFQSFRPS